MYRIQLLGGHLKFIPLTTAVGWPLARFRWWWAGGGKAKWPDPSPSPSGPCCLSSLPLATPADCTIQHLPSSWCLALACSPTICPPPAWPLLVPIPIPAAAYPLSLLYSHSSMEHMVPGLELLLCGQVKPEPWWRVNGSGRRERKQKAWGAEVVVGARQPQTQAQVRARLDLQQLPALWLKLKIIMRGFLPILNGRKKPHPAFE